MALRARPVAAMVVVWCAALGLLPASGHPATEATFSSPSITALSVVPMKPEWTSPLDVTVTVDDPAAVNSATFFMCILRPNSLCYLPETMTKQGATFTYKTRNLNDYPKATESMEVGLKFKLNSSAGDAFFPAKGASSQFGFTISNTTADPTGMYYQVDVVPTQIQTAPRAIPGPAGTDVVAALALASVWVAVLSARRRSRR